MVDIGPRSVTVEMTGESDKIKAFIALVRPLGIKEIVRSGKIAMARSVQLNGDSACARRTLNEGSLRSRRRSERFRPKKIAIIGFGSQGHAHALNLRDSGMDVRVGLRKDSPSWQKATTQGLPRARDGEAAREADIIMMLTPDEMGADIYKARSSPD